MRLIDADALCMHLSDWQFGSMTDGKHDAEYEVINKVIDGIEQEPTVKPIKVGDVCKECWREGGNVVEVVRCKDCRWWERESEDSPKGYCHACKHAYMTSSWEIGIYRKHKPDFFCKDGERRDDG